MMSPADFVVIVGLAAVAWVTGYVAGLPFAYVRRIRDVA